MKKFKIFLRIFYVYILFGFFNLGVSSAYLFLRDGRLDSKLIAPLSSIFLWPIASFSSAKEIFGKEGSQIWNFFNVAGIVLFAALVIFLLNKEMEKD